MECVVLLDDIQSAGIVKLLGMIVSPGDSRHVPDAMATDPTLRPPVCYPCLPPNSRSGAAVLRGMPTRTADAVWGGRVAQEDHTRRASAAHAPRFAPLQAICTLACETRRVLTAIVERATLAMLHPGQALPFGCAVARELLGDDDPRHVRQTLQQLAEKRLRRLGVASALHEDSEDVVVWIDRAPPVRAFAMDRQPYLIHVPLV